MDRATAITSPLGGRFQLMTAFLAATLCATTGCTLVPTDGDPNNDPNNGDPVAPRREILNFNSNFSISELEVPISVLYNVEVMEGATLDSISAFFVEVESDNPGAAPVAGVDVVIIANVAAGSSQFKFDPALSGAGFFRVGLIIVEDGVELPAIESTGVVHVQGTPNPRFLSPDAAGITVAQGELVEIRFDAGDPQGIVQWRLFYLQNAVCVEDPDQDNLDVIVKTGDGNFGFAELNTALLNPGDYTLGILATDSGNSVSETLDNGASDRIIVECGPVVRVVEADTP